MDVEQDGCTREMGVRNSEFVIQLLYLGVDHIHINLVVDVREVIVLAKTQPGYVHALHHREQNQVRSIKRTEIFIRTNIYEIHKFGRHLRPDLLIVNCHRM